MLKSQVPDLVLFFDMEWVPDAHGARRLFDLKDDVTERDAMQRLWEHSPKYNADTNPQPFLKYMFSRVVSIAFLSRREVFRDGEKMIDFRLNSYPEAPVSDENVDESEIIAKFLSAVGKHRPQLVGFNSGESDMQVLIQRGMINEVHADDFCRRPQDRFDKTNDYFTRWDNECHLDILKLFSYGEMKPKLDELAKLCGYPGKIDVKGDQVVDLWLARDITKIVEYNQIDVLNTYLVWLRLVYFCGKIEEEAYHEEQETFRTFLESEAQNGKTFISDFLAHWPE